MAKTNWGAGFSLNTPELLSEAREREEWGDGRIVVHGEHPRWVPAQGKGILAVPAAPKRESNGRLQRATTDEEREARARELERVEPTPELVRNLRRAGPTCWIQRMADGGKLTPMQAQAVEAFAALRRKVGMAEKTPMPVEGRQQPQAPGHAYDEDAMARAWSAYRDACQALTTAQHDAVATLCDQRQPRVIEDMQAGAQVLERFFVRGVRTA